MESNTLQVLTSELAYMEAKGLAGSEDPAFAEPEALLLKFVAHRLWNPEKLADVSERYMPADVEDNYRPEGLILSSPYAAAGSQTGRH